MEHLLFEPIQIGPMAISNRIVMPAMHLNYTMGGEVTEQLTSFYRARALGGVGLIIIGGCAIDQVGGGFFLIGLSEDRFIPGLTRFVEEVCDGVETKVCAQLYHGGRYSFSNLVQAQPIAPSPLGSRYNPEIPREMTLEDIETVQQAFVDAAVRAKKAGLHGVEILASAGYLIAQFLSPVSNQRSDAYGGVFENRARFGCEIIERVKAAVGEELAVLVRVAGADFVPGGHTNDESAAAAKLFAEAGADCIDVTGGWHESRVPQITMGVPEGAYTYLAAGISRAVEVPVIASNRLGDPVLAAQTLADGSADLIAMGRPLIADPELPRKVAADEIESVRPCIACNQGCFDHVFRASPVGCALNPQAGHESKRRITALGDGEEPQRVVVIGAGPGGIEAARVAAARGHAVTLFESREEAGGALWYAGAAPGRQDFLRYGTYLEALLDTLQVDLRLGEEATVASVLAERPDAVVVAAGAEPLVPEALTGSAHPNVVTAERVLSGRAILRGDVVVVGGGAVGVETALLLAERDTIAPEVAAFLLKNDAESPERVKELLTTTRRRITVVDLLPKLAGDMGKTTRWTIMQEMNRYGVITLPKTEVVALDERGVTVRREDGGESVLACQTVVLAVGYRPRHELATALEAQGLAVFTIGDAKTPRKVGDAVHEGFLTALSI